MPRKTQVVQQPNMVTPVRFVSALTKQLESLEKLRHRQYAEAAADEPAWRHLTQSIIEAAFGDPSSSMSRFHRAGNAGVHNIMGISPEQRQSNFEL